MIQKFTGSKRSRPADDIGLHVDTCQLGTTCRLSACLLLIRRNNQCTCLPHFVSMHDASDILKEGGVQIFDENNFHSQTKGTTDLWCRAIGDLIMQMYQYQWKEERARDRDPLSILTLNAPTKHKELARSFGGDITARLQTSQSIIKSSNQYTSSSGLYNNDSNFSKNTNQSLGCKHTEQRDANYYVNNPFVRREPDRSGSLFSRGKDQIAETRAQALQRIEQSDIAAEAAAIRAAREDSGEVCPKCQSPWVVVSSGDTVDGTRSEIWGSKDASARIMISCNKCKAISVKVQDY